MALASRRRAHLFAFIALTLAACSNEPPSMFGGGEGGTAYVRPPPSTSTGGGGSPGGAGGAGGADGASTSSDASSSSASASSSSSGSSSTSSSGSSSSSSSSSASSSSSSASSSSTSGGGPSSGQLRVVAANISSGSKQSYDPGEGIRILQGIRGDLILMQEMNYQSNTVTSLRSLVDQVCGAECAYARGAGDIPNGVVSRYPILASGEWIDPQVGNRTFVWARVDVPGPVELWAISVHLLTKDGGYRPAEASALVTYIQNNIPSSDYVVLGGDLNTDVRDEAALGVLAGAFTVGPTFPADQLGNGNTSAPRSKPYDWVLASPTLDAYEVPVQIGSVSFPTGAVIDTRVFSPIADLAPALATDSDVSGMQHMAVARDFILP